ncbi:DUF2523 family protein [Aquabacterium sp. A3]|uniref:DUF2523 family protein n=1 Tax=Aquabacterium sp. A3 TaxID=3132829 RepID=UPI003119643A
MPLFIAALIGGLVQAASTMAGRVLVGLGIGVAVFSGVSTLINTARTTAFSYLDSAATFAQIAQYMGLLQIGTCVNILFSALIIRLTLRGLQGDTIKRWVTR